MSQVNQNLLQEIVGAIVREVAPEKIILFGSWARGTFGPESDVDFLIIGAKAFGPDHSRRKEMSRIWQALNHFLIPVDILLYTPDEVENWRDSLNHVIGRALREGKVVYERH